jgi:hypothetical protein
MVTNGQLFAFLNNKGIVKSIASGTIKQLLLSSRELWFSTNLGSVDVDASLLKTRGSPDCFG